MFPFSIGVVARDAVAIASVVERDMDVLDVAIVDEGAGLVRIFVNGEISGDAVRKIQAHFRQTRFDPDQSLYVYEVKGESLQDVREKITTLLNGPYLGIASERYGYVECYYHRGEFYLKGEGCPVCDSDYFDALGQEALLEED